MLQEALFKVKKSKVNDELGVWDEQIHTQCTYKMQINSKDLLFISPYIALLLLLLSHFSRVRLCVTSWTPAHQAPLSTEFSRQEY